VHAQAHALRTRLEHRDDALAADAPAAIGARYLIGTERSIQ